MSDLVDYLRDKFEHAHDADWAAVRELADYFEFFATGGHVTPRPESLTKPFWFHEPANGVELTVNSQGADGIAIVAVPPRGPDGERRQYGAVLPKDVARTLARRILVTVGDRT
jgi:hypothetical protein